MKNIILAVIILLSFSRSWSQSYTTCTIPVKGVQVSCTPWDIYKPLDSIKAKELPILNVRVYVHIVWTSRAVHNNFDSSQATLDYVHSVFSKANWYMGHSEPMIPYDSFNRSPVFRDSRIRYNVMGVEWDVDPQNEKDITQSLDHLHNKFVDSNTHLTPFIKDSCIHYFFTNPQFLIYHGYTLTQYPVSGSTGLWGDDTDIVLHHPADSESYFIDAQVIVHELGHSLGLDHPFVDYTKYAQIYGGDDIDDTPAGDRGETNNFMDYNDGNTVAFTAQQVGKMRYELLMNRRGLYRKLIRDWCDYNSAFDITLPGSTVSYWKSPRKLLGNITVPANSQLIISADVSMPENGKILVEPGGYLEIDDCRIYQDCGRAWGGIQVMTSSGSVGSLVMNNAVIQNADIGVDANDESAVYSAGHTQATNCTFRNCRIGVQVGTDNHTGVQNQFVTCKFVADANLAGGTHGTETFVNLDHATNVYLDGDSFYNKIDTTTGSYATTGINAVNSDFTVRAGSYSGTCYSTVGQPCVFYKIGRGIVFSNNGANGNVHVYNAKFIDVQQAISGSANVGADIYRNSFTVDNNIKLRSTLGNDINQVLMSNSYKFNIYENKLFYDNHAMQRSYNGITIDHSTHGNDSSWVYNDSIIAKYPNAGKGMVFYDDNGHIKIQCNDFEGMDTDMYLTATATVAEQLHGSAPAGNHFSTGASKNIASNGPSTSQFQYHYQTASPSFRYNPTNITSTKVNKIPTGNTTYCVALKCWISSPTAPFSNIDSNQNQQAAESGDTTGLKFKLYPNPANGNAVYEYHLSKDIRNGIFTIYDVTGRLIQRNSLNSANGEIQIQAYNLPAGLYYYNATEASGTILDKGTLVISH